MKVYENESRYQLEYDNNEKKRRQLTRVKDLELFATLDECFCVDFVDFSEGNENSVISSFVVDFFSSRLSTIKVILFVLNLISAKLEEIVYGLSNDGSVLALESSLLDDRIVTMSNVAEALQSSNESTNVAIVEAECSLISGFAYWSRL